MLLRIINKQSTEGVDDAVVVNDDRANGCLYVFFLQGGKMLHEMLNDLPSHSLILLPLVLVHKHSRFSLQNHCLLTL